MTPIPSAAGLSSRNWWTCANTCGFECVTPARNNKGTRKKVTKMQDNAHRTQKISRPVDVAQQENACHRAEAVDSFAEIEHEDRAISHDHHFVPD